MHVNISSKGDPDFVCNIEQGENPPNLFEAVTIEDCFEYETAADMSDAASGSDAEPNSAPCPPTNLENPPPAKNDKLTYVNTHYTVYS